MGTSWDEVFGDLDARTLSHDERWEFIEAEVAQVMDGRAGTALFGGQEGELAWHAAVHSFCEGIWVATIMCCHVMCERQVAGILAFLPDNEVPLRWESFGLGRLLDWCSEHHAIPPDLIADLRRVADIRKPYGHWRTPGHPESLVGRIAMLHETDPEEVWGDVMDRIIVDDATRALRTTIRFVFGGYGFGR